VARGRPKIKNKASEVDELFATAWTRFSIR
jgi:hypothetical protein